MYKQPEYKVVLPVDPKNPTHYVDNKQFYASLVEYREQVEAAKAAGLERPDISNYLGDCFIKIARGVAMKHNFRNYSYINDMISAGIEVCLRRVLSFDPDKSANPFAYFTKAIWYSFLDVLEREKKQVKIKRKSFLNMDVDAYDLQAHDETGEFTISIVEFMNSLGTDSEPVAKPKIIRAPRKCALDAFFED